MAVVIFEPPDNEFQISNFEGLTSLVFSGIFLSLSQKKILIAKFIP
jgi:hypothetical protein